jgi:hypothetical protein
MIYDYAIRKNTFALRVPESVSKHLRVLRAPEHPECLGVLSMLGS